LRTVAADFAEDPDDGSVANWIAHAVQKEDCRLEPSLGEVSVVVEVHQQPSPDDHQEDPPRDHLHVRHAPGDEPHAEQKCTANNSARANQQAGANRVVRDEMGGGKVHRQGLINADGALGGDVEHHLRRAN